MVEVIATVTVMATVTADDVEADSAVTNLISRPTPRRIHLIRRLTIREAPVMAAVPIIRDPVPIMVQATVIKVPVPATVQVMVKVTALLHRTPTRTIRRTAATITDRLTARAAVTTPTAAITITAIRATATPETNLVTPKIVTDHLTTRITINRTLKIYFCSL